LLTVDGSRTTARVRIQERQLVLHLHAGVLETYMVE
jgi:hypothetical protein